MATKAQEAANIFVNFQDLRGQKAAAATDVVAKRVASVPEGQRVVLILSKAEFGRLSVPLDLAAAEMIS